MKKASFNHLINNPDTAVLVDFYADWCGPCQTLSPIVVDVAKTMSGKLKVIKVNVDKNQPVAQLYGIRSIPTLIMFKNGKIIWRKTGLLTKRQLISEIDAVLN